MGEGTNAREPPMAYNLIVLLIVLPAAAGFGRAVRRSTQLPSPRSYLRALAVDGFLGLLVLGAIGTGLNFFCAMSAWVSGGLMAIGWVAFFCCASAVPHKRRTSDWVFLAAAVLLVSLHAAREVSFFDTGLYHLQAVLWAKRQAVPFGLANLYGRLGINGTWFVVSALCWLPGMSVAACVSVAGVIVVLFGALVFECIRQVMTTAPARSSTGDWLGVLCVYPLCYDTFIAPLPAVVSVSTDLPVLFLTLTALILLLSADEDLNGRMGISLLLAAFAFSIKLTGIPLFFLVGLAVVIRMVRSPQRRGPLVWSAGVSAAVALLWLARNVVLSGCPLYPSLAGRLPVRWAVPRDIPLMGWIRSFAMDTAGTPETTLASWRWVIPWGRKMLETECIVVAIAIAAGALIACALFARRWRAAELLAWLLSLAGVAYWFALAPDPRFGYGCIFAAGAIPLAVALTRLPPTNLATVRMLLCLALAIAPLIRGAMLPHVAAPGYWKMPAIPQVALVSKRTKQGDVVHLPASEFSLWAAPVPSTAYFRPNLRIEWTSPRQYRAFVLDDWDKQ